MAADGWACVGDGRRIGGRGSQRVTRGLCVHMTCDDVDMTVEDPQTVLRAVAGARGWVLAVVSAARVVEVRRGLESAHAAGAFDPDFYDLELADTFHWEPPSELDEARSVIVVARPATAGRLVFRIGGRDIAVMVPPTYRRFRVAGREMVAQVDQVLRSSGHRAVAAEVPKKALAVGAGLARYGRNNIAYFPRMGSYAQIAAAWSDLPAGEDLWREPVMLEDCDACRACAVACPTGAISGERFLLRGELCVTHLNEWPGSFPEWLSGSAHNALVGCMRCQDVCPADRDVAGWVEDGPAFSDEETRLLLAASPLEGLPAETRVKLDGLDTFMEHGLLCRNLAALLTGEI